MHKPEKTRLVSSRIALSIFLGVSLIGCGPQRVGNASVSVSAESLAVSDVTRVAVTISGSGITPDIVRQLENTNGQWGGAIGGIPVGSDRAFAARAYDASDALIYEGQATGITISEGASTAVVILLQQTVAPDPFTNTAPRITALVSSATELQPGQIATVTVQAEDANGDALTYAWTASGGTFTDATAASTAWTAPATEGAYTLSVGVADGRGGQAGISFVMSIVAARGAAVINTEFNTWPVVSLVRATPGQVEPSQSSALEVTAVDPDGDTLTYAWLDDCGGTFSEAGTQNPIWTAPPTLPPTGTCTVTVTPSDGRGGSTSGSLTLNVGLPQVPNARPVIDLSSQSAQSVEPGGTVSLAVVAHDPEGTPLTFTWSTTGGTLTAPITTAVESDVTWTAPASSGSFTVTATVQDGDGASVTQDFAIAVVGPPGSSGWASICAGGSHSVAVKTDGTLWTWGYNAWGQLGTGDTTDRTTPVQVGSGFTSAAAGYEDTLSVKTDGTLWASGGNVYGYLGTGDTTNRVTPVQVASDVASVITEAYHTLALKTDGTLWAWGYNAFGQLGTGDTTNRLTPVQVTSAVASAAAGYGHTVVVKTDGTLWAWGYNEDGQLGTGDTTNRGTPFQVASDVASVAAGYGHTVAVKTDGTLWAWGDNQYGQLGTGDTTNRLTPVQVASAVAFVAAGYGHTVAVKTDGTLWAWGDNQFGQLGTGDTTNRLTPVQVVSAVASVAAGYGHTLALKADGTLWAWGYNYSGQLGTGDTTSRYLPTSVP